MFIYHYITWNKKESFFTNCLFLNHYLCSLFRNNAMLHVNSLAISFSVTIHFDQLTGQRAASAFNVAIDCGW